MAHGSAASYAVPDLRLSAACPTEGRLRQVTEQMPLGACGELLGAICAVRVEVAQKDLFRGVGETAFEGVDDEFVFVV